MDESLKQLVQIGLARLCVSWRPGVSIEFNTEVASVSDVYHLLVKTAPDRYLFFCREDWSSLIDDMNAAHVFLQEDA